MRGPLVLLVGLGALVAPSEASALELRPESAAQRDPHPLFRLVERERAPERQLRDALSTSRVAVQAPRPAAAGVSSLDCIHARHDIRLDPKSGDASVTLDLEVRADGRALDAIGFVIDEGLAIGTLSADGRAAAVTDSLASPSRVVQIALSPPLEPGHTTTIHVAYGGTLACQASPAGATASCAKGQDFSVFSGHSVFPYLFDPQNPEDTTLDAMTRDIVVRVPAAVDAIATGEKVSDTIEGATHISTWTIDHPLSRTLGMYVLAGKLGTTLVPGRTVPTTLVYPAPETAIDQRLASWSGPVLDFVERLGGTRLPFERSLTLVRLPADLGDPGTATFGMTLLSDSYARAGDLMHEETWAHENSHLFWGIVVPERSSAESRLTTEGLATLSQIEYTWGRHFAGEDRETYLARRFVPIGLDLAAHAANLQPVWLARGEALHDASRTALYTMWAYYETAATLDHLRATVGDDLFDRALSHYVETCRYVGCTPDDFRAVLEATTGDDLTSFFDRWVTAKSRPAVTVGFRPDAGGAVVELTKADKAPMTLALWIRLEDGQLVKRRVDLSGQTTRIRVDAPQGVRSVSTSPRHDVMIDARSAVTGDLDFDGETDGFDILRCTRLVGMHYESSGLGLFEPEETFDPRCDRNGDLTIDDLDLEETLESFGTLRTP